jgi:hypothetical protein
MEKVNENNTKDLDQIMVSGQLMLVHWQLLIKDKDGAIQEYQGVYNRGFYLFMLLSNLKCDYNDPSVLEIVNLLEIKSS